MSHPVVFLGPSLPLSEARMLLTAEFRPPIRRGDLEALRNGATVLILDGDLEPDIRIELGEIQAAMARGHRLIGAASTGAFAAARLRADGMHGIGWVYRAYRAGRIADLDAVAILYAPHDFRPLTVPIVSVLAGLDALVAAGRITARTVAAAARCVRALPVERRDEETVRARLAPLLREGLDIGNGPIAFPDVKAADARSALAFLRDLERAAQGPWIQS